MTQQAKTGFKWTLSGVLLLLFMACTLVFVGKAFAHGYIEAPASRAYLCKLGQNTNCGQVQYEPQSLEAKGNFPIGGPADGQITGAGIFPELYEQTAARWKKVNMNGGKNTFKWTLTAAHATKEWKYYITKKGWNPGKTLARADLEQFCLFNDGGARPATTVTHECNVPTDRSGYYLILAVWEIADTGNAFYQVIDVNLVNGPADTQAPSAPGNLRSPSKTSTSISLAWNASTDNVGVSGYQIFRGTALVATVSGSSLTYNHTGLAPNTTYTYTVKAHDAAGNVSAASNTLTMTTSPGTADTQAPTAPGNLLSTAKTSNSVSLAWNASTDNVGVTGYQIIRDGTLVTTVSGTTLNYIATGLIANTPYTFTVRALDAAGNVSAASNALTVTTSPASTITEWAPNKAYNVGDKVTYAGKTYQCRQAHTSLSGWEPPNTPALWLLI